jgi:hypothetical protein
LSFPQIGGIFQYQNDNGYYLAVHHEDFDSVGEVFNEIMEEATKQNGHHFGSTGLFGGKKKKVGDRKCLSAFNLIARE